MSIMRSGSWMLSRVLVGAGLIAGLVLGLVTVLVVVSLPADTPRTAATVSEASLQAPALTRSSRTQGLAILRSWDQRRAAAWASGDERALQGLYTHDALAGATDRAMLRRWVDRGWVVESLQTQVRGASMVSRSPRRLVIVVTDRLVGGSAVRVGAGVGGERRVTLPRDRWSTRRITLRRIHGDWLVAGVRLA